MATFPQEPSHLYDAVIFPDTTVITRRSDGSRTNLVAFNPLTDTPSARSATR